MFALGYEILKYSRNTYLIVEFKFYEFSSGSWRFLDVTANFLIRSYDVSLKGSTYWLANDNYLPTTETFWTSVFSL